MKPLHPVIEQRMAELGRQLSAGSNPTYGPPSADPLRSAILFWVEERVRAALLLARASELPNDAIVARVLRDYL